MTITPTTKPICKICHCWPCVKRRYEATFDIVEAACKTYIENKFGPFTGEPAQ